jgi:Fe-S cluster biogenesis protein NfuA
MSRPVTIYADHMLVESGVVVEFLSQKEAKGYSTFAEALFNFPFVNRVFIAQNFVTIYKNDLVEWSDVTLEMREFIKEWLMENENAVQHVPKQEVMESSIKSPKLTTTNLAPEINTEKDQQIVNLIDEYVQPAVEQDGGAIHFQSYNEESGSVTVILKGSCSGCPSSTATLKGGVENLLKSHLPEIKEVVALNG